MPAAFDRAQAAALPVGNCQGGVTSPPQAGNNPQLLAGQLCKPMA
jgi:hypothetical protein